MRASSETTFTLHLSEQEYEDLYEAIEAAGTLVVDRPGSFSFDLAARIEKILREFPTPPSRTREG